MLTSIARFLPPWRHGGAVRPPSGTRLMLDSHGGIIAYNKNNTVVSTVPVVVRKGTLGRVALMT